MSYITPKFIPFLLFGFLFFPAYLLGQESFEHISPDDQHLFQETYDPLPANNGDVFKYAWELPRYAEQERHQHLKGKPWIEPADVVEMYVSLQRKREEDNQDTYKEIHYISVRPFALDFGNFSLSFGASYIGRWAHSDDIDKVQDVLVGNQAAVANAEGIETEAYQQAMNFSVLASFPELALQMIFNVGYGTSHLRETIDSITVDAGNVVATLDNFQYKQHDEGVFTSFTFLKSFDRDYFDFLNVFMYGGFRTQTTLRNSNATLTSNIGNGAIIVNSGKQELPFVDAAGVPFADPQSADEFQISIMSATATLRMFTIPMDIGFVQDKGLSLHLFTGIEHVTGELLGEDFYGVRYKLGGVVGIFEGITFRYNYVWETGNDQENAWEMSLSFVVSGIVRQVLTSL